MKVLDLFSGIGGFSLGLERAGMETVAFCEIEDYPRRVLKKHWPTVPIYEDVRLLTAEVLKSDGIAADVICGGFPCQDLSVAGNQKGITAERSGLWSEIARLISEIRPRYAIVENVTALISGDRGRWFGRVLGDLAKIGYDCEWHCIPASEFGAHHHRDRVWIIAYPSEVGCGFGRDNRQERSVQNNEERHAQKIQRKGNKRLARSSKACSILPDTDSAQRKGERKPIGILAQYADFGSASRWEAEPAICRVANGIPDTSHRLRALGNAVVPQIPEAIGRAIMKYEESVKCKGI